jgi:gamma-glutamyltranspeptidase/glutathione hydrolase
MKARRPIAAAAAVVALALAAALPSRAAPPARAEHYMVVTANPHATEAGKEILAEGGSAVDAAIAVQLVLSLVEPQSSTVAGGAFLLYYDAPDGAPDAGSGQSAAAGDGESATAIPKVEAYEGRETAPAAATPDMFLDANGNPERFPAVAFGGLAVGVPGVMRMLELAHRDHGRLPWARLFTPAIELAENGFDVSPRLHFLLDRFKGFARADGFRSYFYDEQGEARPVGYRLVNKEYAETLRLLARDGADAMYTGELGRAIVDRVRNNGLRAGRMTLDDLGAYRAEKSAALCTPYREWRVCGPQLPSSGGITTQEILGMLARFPLAETRADPVRTIHLVAEASRLAFADRSRYLGDPAFVDVPVAGLLDPRYLAMRAALIDPDHARLRVEAGEPAGARASNYAPSPEQLVKSTSHYSIVDAEGDAVAMTTSVQSTFGSQLMVGGFLLNNQLTDFSFAPERFGKPVPNRVEAGKHPLSSMAPTFVLDSKGRLKLAVGSPGGTRIINYVTQAVVGVLDLGLDVQQAVAAPHFLAQQDAVELEQGTSVTEYRGALEALGHRVVETDLNSGLHAIEIEYTKSGRVLEGGIDPRREGVAAGE